MGSQWTVFVTVIWPAVFNNFYNVFSSLCTSFQFSFLSSFIIQLLFKLDYLLSFLTLRLLSFLSPYFLRFSILSISFVTITAYSTSSRIRQSVFLGLQQKFFPLFSSDNIYIYRPICCFSNTFLTFNIVSVLLFSFPGEYCFPTYLPCFLLGRLPDTQEADKNVNNELHRPHWVLISSFALFQLPHTMHNRLLPRDIASLTLYGPICATVPSLA